MIWPLKDNPPISGQFKEFYGLAAAFQYHTGIDFAVGIGTPVYAPVSGKLSSQDNVNKYHGKVLEIESGDKIYRMMHLSSFVKTSGNVQEGELIGYTGNTGINAATGRPVDPHLHYDIRTKQIPTSINDFVDPNEVMKGGTMPTTEEVLASALNAERTRNNELSKANDVLASALNDARKNSETFESALNAERKKTAALEAQLADGTSATVLEPGKYVVKPTIKEVV